MAVRSKRGWLYIDFYCYDPQGARLRCREATGMRDTVPNRKAAISKDNSIKFELSRDKFNYLYFFPHGARSDIFKKDNCKITFSEYWEMWLSEKTIRDNTSKGWNSVYSQHLGPYFGHVPLSQITDSSILVFRKELLDTGKLAASTINDRIIKVLCMCLYSACVKGIISTYPCKAMKRLDEMPVELDPFSFQELRHFLDHLQQHKPKYYDMFLLWSRTGLRPGELYALKWQRVDYFNKKLLIRETHHQNGKDGPPKTKTSVRDVDLSPSCIDALKRQSARTALADGYIFQTEAGKAWSEAYMRKKFRHLLRLAGLKYRSPKNMRHTFATQSIGAGENITWVSKMLGHATVEVTLKRYNRFIPNLTRQDGSALEGMLESCGHPVPKLAEEQR